MGKAKCNSAKIWNKTRIQFLFNIALEISVTAIRQKGIQFGREEVKVSVCEDDTIEYIENPKDSTQKLLDLINEFS